MRPAPFFLVKPRQTDPNFGHFWKRKTKRNDAAKLFFTWINSFNVKNEQCKSISRNSRFAGVSFCFLFPVSDHPTGSLIIVTKTMARMAQKFSFISFFLNTADQACWQIITINLQLVITKGYWVWATTIEGQNTFAPLLLCFA